MKFSIKGKIVSGIGKSAYYVEKYSKLLEEVLGEPPYPGTLNVKLDKCFYEMIKELGFPPLVIKPPHPGLGAVYAYIGRIKDVKVLILKPVITLHECEIVEVVSSKHLKSLLGLKEGGLVEIAIERM